MDYNHIIVDSTISKFSNEIFQIQMHIPVLTSLTNFFEILLI
jgi:hypothetical protein